MASISAVELKSCYPTLLPTHCSSNASSGSRVLGARNSVGIAFVSARQGGFQRFEFKGQRVQEFSSRTSGKDGEGLLLRGRTNGRRPWAIRIVSGKLDTPKPTFVPLEQIISEEHFDQVLREAQERNQPIIIDWLAAWCRKCIYLKPKLEKLSAEYYPDIKFFYVDVNNVPQSLVKRAEVTKMPTIQFWQNGERTGEVIGGHQVWLVLDEIREMIKTMR